MSVFEEVIDSIVKIYVINHKHTVISDPLNALEVLYNQPEHKLVISLNLPDNKIISADLHFSDWAIKSSLTADQAPAKTVLEFAEMIELLIPNFAIAYKNVKW